MFASYPSSPKTNTDRGQARFPIPSAGYDVAHHMKLLYKPVGLVFSIFGALLAGALFKQLWRVSKGESEAPKATDQDRSWKEALAAAAIEGAVFGLVKAAVDRGGATGFARLTGVWPGDTDPKG
jgi:hypothetical protein